MGDETIGEPLLSETISQVRSVTDRVSAAVLESERTQAVEVSHRLFISGRHLQTAAFAADLEPVFDNHHEAIAGLFPDLDHATVATAAPTLVYASSAATLDLCVAALAFWCDRPLGKDGREYDLGEMTTKDGRARQREWVPGWAQQWLDTTIPGQAKHVEFRDRQIHRVQSRSATVGAGGRRQVLAPHNSPDEPTVQERFEAAVRFTSERWQQFWLALDGE